MNKIIQWLSGILVLQLFIVVMFWWAETDLSASNNIENLAEFDPKTIDEVLIKENESQKSLLKKVDDKWILPEYAQLEASQTKVDDLLTKLATLKKTWGVAKTADSIKRFKVDEDKFERHVILKRDNEVVYSLYFGTSPGFKKIHARAEDESVVYSVELNQHELKQKDQDWFDKGLLAFTGSVADITGKDFTLVKDKNNGAWSIKNNKDDETINKRKTEQLISHLRDIKLESLVADEDTKKKLMQEKPASSLTVNMDALPTVYNGYNLKDKYYIKSSFSDHYFSLLKYQYDRLFQVFRKDFVENSSSS